MPLSKLKVAPLGVLAVPDRVPPPVRESTPVPAPAGSLLSGGVIDTLMGGVPVPGLCLMIPLLVTEFAEPLSARLASSPWRSTVPSAALVSTPLVLKYQPL